MIFVQASTKPLTNADEALRRVVATIAVATGLAATGREIDLSGIDIAAGRLCAQVLDLPHEQGRSLRPALCSLDESLFALAQLLQSTQDQADPASRSS